MKAIKSTRLLIVMTAAAVIIAVFVMPVSAAAKVPAKVAGVKATKATDKVIAISWKKAKNAKKYQVDYKKSTAKKWTVMKKTKALKATKSGLKSSTKYNFRVRGINGKKNGKYSKVLTQTTYATPGKVNINTIFAKKRTKGNITLQWSKAANASHYEIEAFQLNGGLLDHQPTTTPSWEMNHQTKPNSCYGYKIRTVNNKTGKFPEIKSAWTSMYYAYTTFGDREITGAKQSDGTYKYKMTGTVPFRIGEDEGLVPIHYIDLTDEYGQNFIGDKLECESVSFPSDFTASSTLAGKTYKVGDTYTSGETTTTIKSFVIEMARDMENAPTNGCELTIKCENGEADTVVEW